MSTPPKAPAAVLNWLDDAIPVATQFDDPYFSLKGGLAETRHVFLGGNDLPARLCPGFHVAELGFGTGLNLLALGLIAQGLAGPIRFTTFEGFPMTPADQARALAHFPEAAAVSAPLIAAMEAGETRFAIGNLEVEIIVGDVRETLPAWGGRADAWFLDGFSPAKNPQMWGEELMAEVGRHTASDGTFATYTAAGHVRRALAAAGFEVERAQGFAGKRHMSRGRMRPVA